MMKLLQKIKGMLSQTHIHMKKQNIFKRDFES